MKNNYFYQVKLMVQTLSSPFFTIFHNENKKDEMLPLWNIMGLKKIQFIKISYLDDGNEVQGMLKELLNSFGMRRLEEKEITIPIDHNEISFGGKKDRVGIFFEKELLKISLPISARNIVEEISDTYDIDTLIITNDDDEFQILAPAEMIKLGWKN